MSRKPLAILEEFFLPHDRPEIGNAWRELRTAWRLHLREHQQATRISSTTLPAVSMAAQEAIAARDHLGNAIAAMSGMTSGLAAPETPDEDPTRGGGGKPP